MATITSSNSDEEDTNGKRITLKPHAVSLLTPRKKKLPAAASVPIARLRSVVSALRKNRSGLGSRVIGTLFGYRHGHVHFSLQKDPNSPPAFLVELATPISGLDREMASGPVRIALECDKRKEEDRNNNGSSSTVRLLEETVWRTYCDGKKCGFATRRDYGANERNILKALEPISMGGGVLPATETEAGEVMYMRATFERIVGSRDSEAFYMMNPDSNGAPELSVYLLRV
ncbi:putative TATA-binding protein-associated phosphoprotein [Hibiscus syriacus]|uniref:TATA-binding protein-associated phosphoprotein n=1 Tax=Hibiscus syriacus TaxID=106335 RepID=A0A6A2ZS28_HIBSY|nr:protein MIZU-KUSSEI 1-like [Hibiscus syriacus]KAE8693962.1 putative TATA-binding protein-associated phosphoprotein [Hibiscus syriacus]